MKRHRVVALGLVAAVIACSGSGLGPMDASTEGGSKDSGEKDSTTMDSGSDAQPNDSGSDGGDEGGGDASDGSTGDGSVSAQCTVPATPPSGGSCITLNDAGIQCNPVTNAPCDADAGLGCDTDFKGGYACLPKSTVAVCGACNEVNGPYCIGTATCLPLTDAGSQECYRYCCTDSDCTPGHCDKTTFGISPLGACAQ
jgi:hypothetical protein